jgi:hypothetical protein
MAEFAALLHAEREQDPLLRVSLLRWPLNLARRSFAPGNYVGKILS